jgi:hypothetical protein
MNGTKLQVVVANGQMEMSWDGETFYNGPVLNAVEATRCIRQWHHLDFAAATAIWHFREELVLD